MGSALRPGEGTPVRIGGVEFHFSFTFAAIDELQTYYNAPISEIINKLTDNMTVYSAAGHIIEALIRSNLFNNGEKSGSGPAYDEIMHVLDIKDTGRIISTLLRVYGIDMPDRDEDDDEDPDDGPEKINLARLLVIARTELRMDEADFWKTTPRKFFMLFDEYVALKGGGKESGGSIDDLP